MNAVYGRPNVGKSFVGIMAAKEPIQKGGRVLWVDAEDTADTMARRADLLDFEGATSDAFWYTGVDLVADKKAMAEIVWWLGQTDFPSLVVIDACESAGCPSDGTDVRPWLSRFVDPFAKQGIGVLMLDHIPKNSEGRAAGQIGSQYKMAALSGAGLLLTGKPWNQVAGGFIRLKVEKDRQGQLPVIIGDKVTTITGDYVAGEFQYGIGDSVGGNQVSMLGNKVLLELAQEPEGLLGNSEFIARLKCNRDNLIPALKALVEDGLVDKDKEGKYYRYMISTAGLDHVQDSGTQAEMGILEAA